MRNIYVFYPTQVIGGAELLFVRLLNYISQHYPQIKVGYINFVDSCINELLSEGVERIAVDKSITLPENSTIVAPPQCIYRFPQIKTKDINFLFFILSVLEPDVMCCFSRTATKNVIDRVQTMITYNALIVMDEATKITTQKFCSFNVNENMLMPVVLEDYQTSFLKESLIDEQYINLAWIGRLSADKIYALINLMDNLEKLKIDKKIKLHIIGEGDSGHLIGEYKNFEIIYLGTLFPKDLPLYIQNNIDIVFAMGTSMLESEKCGVPAVMVFLTMENSSKDCFLWTFKLQNYVLGYDAQLELIPQKELMTLEQILNDFLLNMSHRSKQARDHFESFLIDRHIVKFLKYANETSYTKEILKKEKLKIKLGRILRKVKKYL